MSLRNLLSLGQNLEHASQRQPKPLAQFRGTAEA